MLPTYMSVVIYANPSLSALSVSQWPTTIKPQEHNQCFQMVRTTLAHSKANDHSPRRLAHTHTRNSSRRHSPYSPNNHPNPRLQHSTPPSRSTSRNRKPTNGYAPNASQMCPNVSQMRAKCAPSSTRKRDEARRRVETTRSIFENAARKQQTREARK